MKLFVVPEEVRLPLGGITPFTTIDYPGHLAAVLYTRGCPWSCLYCHNAHLRDAEGKPEGSLSWQEAIRFLEARRELLEGVVFCGGEPTYHEDLPKAMAQVKALGYKIGLHTSGMYPVKFQKVLLLSDWVGMDVKAPFSKYEKVTQVPASGLKPEMSIDFLIGSGVPYEFRTTLHPSLLSEDDILQIAQSLKARGAKRYVIQAFRPDGCENEALRQVLIPSPVISEDLSRTLGNLFESFEVRQ